MNVGKDQSSGRFFNTTSKFDEAGVSADGEGSVTRTLGVSLLGACSSKGCPTKSVENEDRYAHVSFSVFWFSVVVVCLSGGDTWPQTTRDGDGFLSWPLVLPAS